MILNKTLRVSSIMLTILALIIVSCDEVYAASGEKQLNSLNTAYESGEIAVTTQVIEDTSAVYSLDVIWGSMNFGYTAAEWNPEGGGYETVNNWYVRRNTANDIKVENHSNKEVNISMTMEVDADKYGQDSDCPINSSFRDITDYSGGEGVEDCSYVVTGQDYNKATSNGTIKAWGEDVEGKTSVYSKELCFSGALPESFQDGSSIGVVTVTLSP